MLVVALQAAEQSLCSSTRVSVHTLHEVCLDCHRHDGDCMNIFVLQNMVPVAEAREVKNAAEAREAVEAAQAAASAALAAELEVARKGRADAEARESALQEEVTNNCTCPKDWCTIRHCSVFFPHM